MSAEYSVGRYLEVEKESTFEGSGAALSMKLAVGGRE
jgi:hypothetical protein